MTQLNRRISALEAMRPTPTQRLRVVFAEPGVSPLQADIGEQLIVVRFVAPHPERHDG